LPFRRRKLHTKELFNFYSLPKIMRVIDGACIQNTRKAFRILLGIPERKNRLENIGKGVRIMFRVSILKHGLGLIVHSVWVTDGLLWTR
jgi:hypothetical protein